MISALFTSASALAASQTQLSVVGNNLANSSTTGFKSQSVLFSDQFSQLIGDPSQPTATSGGKNPLQVGMGVQVASTDTNLTEGTFQSTGNSTDLAIQGNGYFVLNSSGQTAYSRDGSFAVDADGKLVDPATGAKVQRTGIVGEGTATTPSFQTTGNSDINIPAGLTIPGFATQNINFAGNLNANATGPRSEVLTSGQALTVSGVPATVSTSLDSLDQTLLSTLSPAGYAAGDSIDITGTLPDGSTVSSIYSPTGTPASDTIGSLLSAINQAFHSGTAATGATATLDPSGKIVLTANQPGKASATLSLSSNASNPSGTTTQFSNFVQTVAGKAGDTATSVIQVYDNQGTSHNVTFSFEKAAGNQWNVKAAMDPADGTITGFGKDNTVNGLTFNSNGSLALIAGNSTTQALTTQSAFSAAGVAATLTTTLDSLDQHTGAVYGAADVIQISGTDYNGATITPVSVPASGATIGDLVTAINTAFGGAIATLDASGSIQLASTHSGQSSLKLNISDSLANTGGTTAFGKFVETTPGTNGDTNIRFQINNLAGNGISQTVNLAFGSPNGFNGVTQTGGTTTVSATSQDGYAQGTLQDTSVSTDGTITGKFSNGQSVSIAQIAIATFSNPAGLEKAGNNYLASSTASGLGNISTAKTGGAGSIKSGGLEGSNVDTATEFTQLIAAQRAYEANAKVFTTANSLMQAAIDLIR